MLNLYKISNNKLSSEIHIPINSDGINSLKSLESSLDVKFVSRLRDAQFKGSLMERCSFEVISQKKNLSINFIGLGEKNQLDEEKVFKVFSSITYSRVKSKKKNKRIICNNT